MYRVSVDGRTRFEGSSNVEDESLDAFQTTLFEEVMDHGQHTVTLLNLEDKWLDVDFVSDQ